VTARVDAVEFRAFEDGDEHAIIEGLSRRFGCEVSLEQWSWGYPAAPEGRPVVVGTLENEVVAHVGAAAGDVRFRDRTLSALKAVDLFADEEMRDREVSASLLQGALQAFMAEHAEKNGGLLLYCVTAGGPLGLDGPPLLGSSAPLLPLSRLVRRERARGRPGRLFFRAEPARDWEPRLGDLWSRVRESYPAAAVRDPEMAIRRHAGHPDVRFHRFLVFPRFSRHPVAFVVFDTAGSACRWVDLVWDHRSPGALDLVAHLSRQLAAQVGASEETVVLGGDPAGIARLESAGFETAGGLEQYHLTVLSAPEGITAADLAESFYVTDVDLDPMRRAG
jgi:hypothetical protein